jgi:AcrR family transcriptional regulator
MVSATPRKNSGNKQDLLRSARQERTEARIAQILDAAAEVLVERGYSGATTNHVAAAAGISPGTLYHWFPDFPTLAEALVKRYTATLGKELLADIADSPELTTPSLIRITMHRLLQFSLKYPAMVSLIRADAPGQPGAVLRRQLEVQTSAIVLSRVEVTSAEAIAVSAVCLNTAFAMLARSVVEKPKARKAIMDETIYALTAYLVVKYPGPDSPLLTNPHPALPPSASPKTAQAAARST